MRLRLDPFSPNGVSVDNSTVTVAGGSSSTSTPVTVTGEDYLSLSAQEITANPIDLDNLSATGTPSGSTFLRGDNTWATPAGSGDVSKVGTPVNNQVGVWTGDGTIEGDADLTFDTATNTLTTVNIAPSGTVDGRDIATDGTKLDGIETGADVTDATNVDAAGATMNADTSLAGNGYFLDEDNMASNSATKVPSQQSVKAYVDAVDTGTVDSVVAGSNIDVDATDPANPIVSVETLTLADISDVTASTAEVNVLDGIPATLTATELGYVDGVTSAIQTQIDGKQPLDADLTSWAGVTRASGFDTFATTPSSANLASLVTGETGSGALVFGTSPNITTPTGIVKGDVGLGNVDNTSDATKNAASVTLTNKSISGTGNTITNINPGMWKNPYCFSAYASGSTTLTDASFVKVAFATEEYDYNNNFASSTYTAPVAGVYHFDALVSHATVSVSSADGLTMLYKNGSVVKWGTAIIAKASSTPSGFPVSADILLAANDTVEVYHYQDSGGNEATTTTSEKTYFSGHLVHAT